MEVLHKEFLIVPGAREDALGRWMPVVSVSRRTKEGVTWSWPAQTIVSERHKSRRDAEDRSVEIAKQMIDRGQFKVTQATRGP